MEFINTTFAHGNGPYSRNVDLSLAVNEEFRKRRMNTLPIVVPLVYGDRQKRIMLEDFGDIIKKNPELILLDEFHGEVLRGLLFHEGTYQENLEAFLERYNSAEEKLRNHLAGELELKTFEGKTIRVKGKDVALELSHNPRLATGCERSFYTTIAYFSEILEKAATESELGLDKNLLLDVKKIAERIENDRGLHFMPEPFVFSYDKNRKVKKEIFTPPFIHPPRPNYEDVQEGMYVTITGIDGLRGLFDDVEKFGMKLYCPPFIKLEGADNTHVPEFVGNPRIIYQFARTGWSSVWWSHMSETPLIAPAYTTGDDPEIYFNERTVRALGLAVIFDSNKDPTEVLRKADALRPGLKKINSRLLSNYGTLDGINYTAKVIVDSLEGKDITSYRQVRPVLST